MIHMRSNTVQRPGCEEGTHTKCLRCVLTDGSRATAGDSLCVSQIFHTDFFFFFLKKARLDSGSFRTKPNIWEAGHIWMVDRLTRHPDVWGQAGLWSSLYPGDMIKGTWRFLKGDRAWGAFEGSMSVSEGPLPAGTCPRASLPGGGSFFSYSPSCHPHDTTFLKKAHGASYAWGLHLQPERCPMEETFVLDSRAPKPATLFLLII